ncbi:amino acid ABC transporter permease [Marispirochaeta aestuarii]|uniref:Putative glutamine transport system permease protein GlnP n=1 Tax=Marispirochaeta aestuarii TaxID=1963862 RepID=A0A1Y1RZY2_9SPIO|nr:amino acid ABC transporter permease [Marispirochaeta aestuarii]ORC35595.1 amino acid ABC transporter permease [Marispirochaeta aestuarii]
MAAIDQPAKGTRIEVTDGALLPVKSERGILNSWRVTFVFSIVMLAILFFFYEDPYSQIVYVVAKGIPITFNVTVFAILGSIFIGLFAGLGQISRVRIVNLIAGVYIELIRGIPLLVQLIFIYYALGRFFKIEGAVAAIIALSICYGAYMGEIFRAGIQSIPKGQMEAALALGLSRGQAMRLVILPQTIKIILPAIGNEFIAMLKDSSLVSVIALRDILRRGREYIARTFLSLETMAIVALVYLVITLVLSKLVAILEDRMKTSET